jgi:mRNA (guanine-N7-)-methyltransferase
MCYQYKLLRVLHNKIKDWMIQQTHVNGENRLLDIGCGRGGDIFKWHKHGIRHVIGVDCNDIYIAEAKKRYAQMCSSNSFEKNTYRFFTVDEHENVITFLKQKNVNTRFDHVSCQFALHYFFEKEETIRNLLANLSSMLYVGGLFMCTIMNGDKVVALLKDCENMEYMNSAFAVYSDVQSDIKDFGHELKIHIAGTVYFGDSSVSVEYIVKPDVLVRLCKEYHLELQVRKDFKQFQSKFNILLQDDTSTCSELYECFIFKKVSS